ncbi:MAG: DNA methyltransferase, partial [Lysobacteraceae bacterium]
MIHIGDCLEVMRGMAAGSVHTCVTSPPYFGLRDYGHDGQIGLEQKPEEYVSKLVEVFREVHRVLRDDGTLWLNLGDSYANDGKWGGSSGGKHASALHGATSIGRGKVSTGLKPKDLIGIPWRIAFALQEDGWFLRQDI